MHDCLLTGPAVPHPAVNQADKWQHALQVSANAACRQDVCLACKQQCIMPTGTQHICLLSCGFVLQAWHKLVLEQDTAALEALTGSIKE